MPFLLLIIIAMLSIGIILAYWNMQRVQTEFNSYIDSHHYTDTQYQALTAPKLVAKVDYFIDDKAMDIWIGGWVHNVGQYNAYNCQISIYGDGGNYEVNKSVALGTIAPYGSAQVNTHVSYSDSGVYGVDYIWEINPEWTSTP